MAAPGLSLLDTPVDLFALETRVFGGPDPDQPDPFTWTEDAGDGEPAAAAPPAPAAPALQLVPKRSLRAHVEGVDAIAATIEQLDDSELTPEVQEELSQQLIAAITGTKQKVDATNAVLALFASLAAAADRERERLEKRAAHYTRQGERLEKYVLAVLEASQLDRIDGETSTLARRLNPPAVQIDPGTELMAEYLFYPEVPAPRPDKAKIAKALKAKRPIAGCRLVQSARLVRS